MSRAPLPLLAWAALLAGLAAMLWIWTGDAIPIGMLGGAAVMTLLITAAYALRHRGRAPPEERRAVPDVSLGATAAAIALAAMAYGAVFGLFLVFIGAGVLVLALARIALELRSERRSG